MLHLEDEPETIFLSLASIGVSTYQSNCNNEYNLLPWRNT